MLKTKNYTTLDICDYIIQICNHSYKNYGNKYHYVLSNFSINPILFFLNIVYLSKYNQLLTDTEFDLTDMGARNFNIYKNFKVFGGNQLKLIPPLKTLTYSLQHNHVEDDSLHYHPENIPNNVKKFLQVHVSKLYQFKPSVLVNMSENLVHKGRTVDDYIIMQSLVPEFKQYID